MFRLVCLMSMGLLASLDAGLAPNAWAALPATRVARQARPSWREHQTQNFCIRWHESRPIGPLTCQRFEALRNEIGQAWPMNDKDQAWEPKCLLVIHPTKASYLAAVGAAAECTVASSVIDFEGNAVVARRIDARGDSADWLSHVPHELTHLIVKECIPDRNVPVWADEGIALLVDPLDKQAAHHCDLRRALACSRAFPLAELVQLNDYPAAERMGAFYGQSLSLVEFLLARGDREQLLAVLRLAGTSGYDTALRSIYQIDGLGDLERQWRLAQDQSSSIAQR